MSTETQPETKLSKEEKRLRKEAKKARKAAAAENVETADAEVSSSKEKKRKREEGAEAVEPVVAEGEAVAESKKDKKKKKKEKAAEGVADVAVSAPEEDAESSVKAEKKDKKEKKAKKDKSNAEPEAIASSSSAVAKPAVNKTFSSEHNAYLEKHNITLSPSLYPPQLAIQSLPIPQLLLDFLKQFANPTPIQACSWPALLDGRDVVGIAETGSGKTLAFGIPALNHLQNKAGGAGAGAGGKGKKGKGKSAIGVLVLAPTRELAMQSHENLEKAGKTLGIESICIYGGVSKQDQYRELNDNRVKIVVGTPGRVLDLANEGALDLSGVSYLVLDEADRMLDQGFENDIRRIIAHCPGHESGRQTVMFSATWPESVRRLASTFLRDPIKVTVGSDELSANKRIEQIVEVLDSPRDKDFRMMHHLKQHLKAHPSSEAAPTRILVFALYKKEAQRLEFTIRRGGYTVVGLHGDLDQATRFKALEKFKKGEVNVLVATDVAARGLDIPDVGLVVNVTFPLTTEDFVHRCGRTGRAGKTGKAVTFFTGEAHEKSLAGEFMRVLRDAGAEVPKEMDRFPTTIKKKEHGSYGAFYKDTSNAPAPTKITFD